MNDKNTPIDSNNEEPLVDGIAEELRAIIDSAPKEEINIFMELIADDDPEAFEKKMRSLHGEDKKHEQKAEKKNDPDKINAKKEFESKVVLTILDYFDRDSKLKQEEALSLEKKLTGKIDSQKISENEAKVLSRSDNPYIRMLVASHGFCAKTLSNDPVSYIRLEVLKKTGVYSEHYREKEKDLSVIKELINQGIDNDFYRNFNEKTRYMVEVQEVADEIIEAIESGCKDTYQDFMIKLTRFPEELDRYSDAQIHIDILIQDLNSSLSSKNKSEILKENKKAILAKTVLEHIKIGEETSLGVIKSIQKDKIIIEGFEPEGIEVDYHPSELYDHISLSKSDIEDVNNLLKQ